MTTLAYSWIIFIRLKTLNLSLQSKSINLFLMHDKIKAFIEINEVINNNVLNKNLLYFSNLK